MIRILFAIGCICGLWGCTASEPDLDKVYLRLGADIEKINPLLSGDAYARQVEELLFQPLYQFDNEGEHLLPVLAEGEPTHSIVNGKPTWKFKIKSHAQWGDGQPVTGRDVQFTFRQIFNPFLPTYGFKTYLSFLDSIKVDESDPSQFVVYGNTPYFLAQTVVSNIEIFPAHFHDPKQFMADWTIHQLKEKTSSDALPGLKNLAEDFIALSTTGKGLGSGPYEMVNWERGVEILLKKKENYWGENDQPAWLVNGQSDWIDFRIIPDIQAGWQSLRAGELDVMNEIPDKQFLQSCSEPGSSLQCWSPNQYLYYYIGLNRNHPALANSELRKAVAQCFDLDRWLAEQMEGLATPIHNPISPLKSYYLKEASHQKYQPVQARKTFTEQGWIDKDGDGFLENEMEGKIQKLQLRYAYVAANDVGKKIGIFFKSLAAASGLEIILEPLDFATLQDRMSSRNFDLFYLANYDPPADYDPRASWHTESIQGLNYSGFGTAESDQLIEQIGRTLEANERIPLYRQFQRMILQDQPCIFLFSPKQKIMAANDVELLETGLWPGYKAQSVRRK